MRQKISLFLVILAAGCAPQASAPPRPVLPPAGPQKIELIDLSTRTSATEPGQISGDDLLAQVGRALQTPAGGARVLRLVQRYPDVALELLRNLSTTRAAQPAYVAVTSAYDRLFVSPGSATWSDAIAHAAENQHVAELREQLLAAAESGQSPPAISMDAPSPFLSAELLRLRALAELVTDHTSESLHDLQSAQTLATGDCNVSAELALLHCITETRSNDMSNAAADWSRAADLASKLRDPALWQRLIDARPATTPWPPQTAASFSPSSPQLVEAGILHRMGQWHISRNEGPVALVDLKNAEAEYPAAQTGDCRLDEARALFLMKQEGAAIAMLSQLTADPTVSVRARAFAMLGDAQVNRGDAAGALDLLHQAVSGDEALTPADRAPGRADLGLVYLMQGQEKEGLLWLHKAQADFTAAGDDAELAQSLGNEAAYWTHTGHADQAAALQQKAALISQHFSPDPTGS